MNDTIRQALLRHQRWLDGESDGVRADVSGTDFSGEDLSAWDFRQIVAQGCKFAGARMPARMQGGDFTGSDFTGAYMDRANVEGTDFTDCDLRGASMYYVAILNAIIAGARFSDNVILWIWGILMGVDFADNSVAIQSTAEGLKTALAAIVSGGSE